MVAANNIDQLTSFSSGVIRWLFTWSWQVLVVFAIAWLAIRLDRSNNATVRYRIWLMSLAVASILPLLSVLTQSLHFSGVATPINWPAARLDDFGGQIPITGNGGTSFSWLSLGWPILLAIWVGGMTVSTVRFCASMFQINRIRSRAKLVSVTELDCSYPDILPLDSGVASIRLSSEIRTPGLSGWMNPVILLPEDIASWTNKDERLSILRHEFAHVKRYDHLASLFQSVLKSIFFFHPAVRYACNQLSLERELACDDRVLGLGTEPSAYAESILKAIERSFLADVVHQAASFATRRKLEKRIDMILDTNRVLRPLKQWRFLILPSVLVCAGMLLVVPAPGRATNMTISDSSKTGSKPVATSPVLIRQDQSIPEVALGSIWVDEVRRGPITIQVRGLGTLVSDGGEKLKARVILPVAAFNDIEPGQQSVTDTHSGVVAGKVYHKYGIREDGATFQVDLTLDGEIPANIQDGASIDGTIQIGQLDDVLYVGRPAHGAQNTTTSIFKVNEDGTATRVKVKFGKSSVNAIQILDGLQVGDKIILSDMSSYDVYNSIRLK